jgi:general secretion pathway protein F
MKVGQVSSDYLSLILAGLAGLVVLAVIGHRNGKLKIFLLRALGRFKFVQHYLRLYQLARIYQTMSMLLKGGYTLSDAIPLAQNLAFEKKLQDQILRARGVIQEGKRLSTAFAENGLTDTVTERLLQVGERSGNLARIMDIIAQTYRQEFTVFIDRATRVAEPILLMAVGIMIGAIIILMYMPVFDLAGGI